MRLLGYGSGHHIALVFADPPETDPAVRGAVRVDTEFHRLHAGWTHRFSDRLEQEISVAAGPTHLGLQLGDAITLDTRSVHVWTRASGACT